MTQFYRKKAKYKFKKYEILGITSFEIKIW